MYRYSIATVLAVQENMERKEPISPHIRQDNADNAMSLTLTNSPILHTNLNNNIDLNLRPPVSIRDPDGITSSPNDTNNTSGSSPHSLENGESDSGSQYKIDLTKIDSYVSKILEKLRDIRTIDDIPDVHALINEIKSTILRMNLNNSLLKNEILNLSDDFNIERTILIRQFEDLEKQLNLIKNENNELNSRNLKYIKYIKTLKTEKVKRLINENNLLKEHIMKLENQLYHQQQQNSHHHAQQQPILPTPIAMQHSRTNDTTHSQSPTQLQSPTTTSMLNTLGILATEYLNNDYPAKTSPK